MNVEYLWADDCYGCLTVKHHDITRRVRLVIESLDDVWFSSELIGTITKTLEMEDGEIMEKPVHHGRSLNQFADRRADGYTGLGTPCVHLVDPMPQTTTPTIGQYNRERNEIYEEIFLTELFGDEMKPLQKTWMNHYYNKNEVLDRKPKPELVTRLLMSRIHRFYRHNVIDTPEHTRAQLRELQPDLEVGKFDFNGWVNAFTRLYELQG